MSRNHSRIIGVIVFIIGIAAYIFLQAVPIAADRETGIPGFASHANDYKHVYLGSRMLWEGINPYPPQTMVPLAMEYREVDPRFGDPRTDQVRILPYVYLPFTGFVMTPLSMLSFAESVLAFQIANHILLLAAIILTISASGLWKDSMNWTLIGIALLACAFFFPLYRQNNAGQFNVVLLFGYALIFFALKKRWPDWSIGLLTAFFMLFKLSPGILLIWFLLRKEWSKVIWVLGFALFFSFISILAYGWKVHLDFLPVLSQMGYGKSTWDFQHTFWRDPYNQSFNALFHKLLVNRPDDGIESWGNIPHGVANAFTWVVSIAILGVVAIVSTTGRQASEQRFQCQFAVVILASLLLPSIMWDHYLTQTITPLILLAGVLRNPLALVIIGVSFIAMALRFDFTAYREGAALILMNWKLFPVVALFAVAAISSFEKGAFSGSVSEDTAEARQPSRPSQQLENLPPHV